MGGIATEQAVAGLLAGIGGAGYGATMSVLDRIGDHLGSPTTEQDARAALARTGLPSSFAAPTTRAP